MARRKIAPQSTGVRVRTAAHRSHDAKPIARCYVSRKDLASRKGVDMYFGKRSILLWISVALFCAAIVHAQTSEAELTGQVKDPSGAPVAGAKVTAMNQDTGFS